jgi:hypothetical protein
MGTTRKVRKTPTLLITRCVFSYIYDRTRPYLFDLRLNDRPFQHLCLLLLFNKSHTIDINYHPISVQEFLRDLCYMLMSISSQTFEWNEVIRIILRLTIENKFSLIRFIKNSNFNQIFMFLVIHK